MKQTVKKTSRGGRGALTTSKLVSPDSPVYATASQFQYYMHLPDPLPLYTLLSAVAGNMLTGNPCWLMLVGASGTGKTSLLKSLGQVPYTVRKSSIKGEAALISAVKKKDRALDSTGGVLRELQWGESGEHARGFGGLVFLEFTSVLSMKKDDLGLLLGALREVYDGQWERDVGGEGGRSLHWRGQIGVFAGVTHVIDRHADDMAKLGHRFIYLRLPQTDGYAEAKQAGNITNSDVTDLHRQALVAAMFQSVGLNFKDRQERRQLAPGELDRIVGLAQFAARARSSVAREQWGQSREVIEVPTPEIGTRMTQELAQIYLGGEAIGLDEEDRWRMLGRIAMDSIPMTRAAVLGVIVEASLGMGMGMGGSTNGNGNRHGPHGAKNGVASKRSTAEVAKLVACGETTVRRELENLQLLKIIERGMSGMGGEGGWKLNDWARVRVKAMEVGQ